MCRPLQVLEYLKEGLTAIRQAGWQQLKDGEKCGTPIVTSHRLSAIKNTAKTAIADTDKWLHICPNVIATLVSLDLTVLRNSVQSSKDVCERRIREDFMSLERR